MGVVYFRFVHRLGRPHYMWDEYLYGVLEEVEGICLLNIYTVEHFPKLVGLVVLFIDL